MIARGLLFLVLVAVLALARLPATLMDSALAAGSGGKLRLAAAEGSFWRGSGVLAVSDGQRTLRASRAVTWSFGLSAAPLGAVLHISEHRHPQARLRLTPGGVAIEQLGFDLPLDLVAASVPHPAARAGWRGRLLLSSAGFGCDWRGQCEGGLIVHWRDAGLDIVPDRELGSHEIRLQALGKAFDVQVSSLEGDIRIAGNGRLEPDGRFGFEGVVEGDPDVVDRIPNVMDRNARLTDTAGRVLISLP
ncbi:MAG: type II secretion system protein N [Rhodocyclaceae bacterium]